MTHPVSIREIKVGLDFGGGVQTVGRLALRDHQIYFGYDPSFVEKGVEISPFYLPLKSGVSHFDSHLFEGLPGVFNDSLPDGWGRLLFDRFARTQGLLPTDITPLDRLAHVGSHALGSLVFAPECRGDGAQGDISLDRLASQAQEVLNGSSGEVLAELIALNGASAGARPKALIGVNNGRDHMVHGAQDIPDGYTPWIVKFPNSQDGLDAGAIEYVYALMAKESGLTMSDIHLFPSRNGPGYFAIKRFDRDVHRRYHMHTACGLLHSDFRTPSLDYENLIELTGALTRDARQVEKLYQLAVFNVLAYNRDDHAKNFSYLMDALGRWRLAPAYDLTFSPGPGGEQSTMVMGEGKYPGVAHLLRLATAAKIKKDKAVEMIDRTKDSLSKWPVLAKQHGVSDINIQLVQSKMAQVERN